MSADPFAHRSSGSGVVRAAAELIAVGGPVAVSAEAVAFRAGISPGFVAGLGTNLDLLELATRSLTATLTFPMKLAPDERPDAAEVVELLTAAHQEYVRADPVRFAALAQLTGACLFGHPQLRPYLQARSRRTRAAAASWFRAAADLDDETVTNLALSFTETLNGIELCHLFDADTAARDAGYRETSLTFGHRLAAT